MSKFKVGDRVTIKEGLIVDKQYNGITFLWGMLPYCKKSGIIKFISVTGTCTVDFKSTKLYLSPCMLQHVNEKIIIYRNGAEVVAKNTATGKTGEAKCNPDDEFDFNIGATLAFERLINPEPEKPKYYTGKVVCVSPATSFYTKGKIYEIKDGVGKDDDGDKMTNKPVKSFEEFSQAMLSKFIELVE